ncbi:putative membrane protein [Erwinia phage pEa_SNUABM_50]|uniref:Uncharacterized protein n=4 Tax=Eneladusvirus BF TaxID=2560751 RepID=A0A1S6UB56_9CAUD|nr:membrane protein [Serratia phage BF]QOI71382.1 putative membrane protein [Erwinia phage pEa_SNUABM_12]QOI71924.1 putative membrane protein [Erwinia phage pEa_SNUABM_47]QOI72464.1 putative membrane protein [Erwinia phage pEa_SNUABM_50]QXO11590.1 hypothetical protein pEaSNUABM19_00456 [Erwinia phage pEa_SNUABM_19]QXO12138.1 hypothetical protein pEaSNUABM44_00454 [Erwinia phage pEa_SNUABM_44]QXO12692.1 hypothetical protein pEaSNUABM49_00458 [Erwinia phage pEa_SNUABM_49]
MGAIILYSILGFLGVFTLYMFVVTSAMGTERLKTSQYFMSSLSYSEEATVKINLLIDKYQAGLLKAKLKSNVIEFTEMEGNALAGEIYIANKYFSYGQLYRYGANGNTKWQCNKPDLKTFKRIIKLEKQLDITDEVPVQKSTSKSSEEQVILD